MSPGLRKHTGRAARVFSNANLKQIPYGRRISPPFPISKSLWIRFQLIHEHLLLQSLGEKHLRGFQIGIYLLGLVAIILGGIGFGFWGTHISWKIGPVPMKWILLAAALVTYGVMAYFDRNLPGKNYRSSIMWLECIVEAFSLACIFGNSIISLWDIDDMTERIMFILIIAVLMVCLFAARIIAARTNREEYEMQKNRQETDK